jgi:D-lyxose ketol-isomerase
MKKTCPGSGNAYLDFVWLLDSREGGRFSLSSEISSVCGDWNNNVFFEKWAMRFPQIVEDEPREFYLCQEYPKAG